MTAKNSVHDKWMAQAMELARRGEGLTRPNPPVGAIVVKGRQVVGEGFHKRAGGAHAEKTALQAAGPHARGATLYVTLEPCCTWGRTGPCTDLVTKYGVSRVVVAARDPNPAHRGRGIRELKKRGVDVVEGVQRKESEELIKPFAKWVSCGMPYLTLKLGMTVDGMIADETGSSRWITGPDAREKVQDMRRRVDAIMVGANTIVKDNPRLTPRPAHGRKPFRVIADSIGSTPASANVLTDGKADRTILAVTSGCPSSKLNLYRQKGARVLATSGRGGRVDPTVLLRQLGEIGVMHVLCEGGGRLAGALIRQGLVDEFALFYAPSILGDGKNIPGVGGRGWLMPDRPHLRFLSHETVGSDILVRAAPVTDS